MKSWRSILISLIIACSDTETVDPEMANGNYVENQIEVLEPIGNFYVDPETSNKRHIICIGGGSGITPLISMLKTILAKESDSSCTLIFANRNEDSTIFKLFDCSHLLISLCVVCLIS